MTLKRNGTYGILPIMVFAALSYMIVYRLISCEFSDYLSDYNSHTYVYLMPFLNDGFIKGWLNRPYCLFQMAVLFFLKVMHLPLELSSILTGSLFFLFSYLLTVFMIKRFCEYKDYEISGVMLGFLSFVLNFVQPFYLEYLDLGTRTAGAFSINPLYSPTQMAAKPFSLICFMLVIDIVNIKNAKSFSDENTGKNEAVFFKGIRSDIGRYIVLALTLLISETAKPVFAEMFIPAVGIYFLCEFAIVLTKEKKHAADYFKKALLPMFLCALPAIAYMLIQTVAYFAVYGNYDEGSVIIITKWLEVWSLFTENVPLSIIFGMAFPIYVIVIDSKNFVKTGMGRLGLISYAVGFLEAALLGENGSKLYDANFMWPMMFGMLILWITTFLHFVGLTYSEEVGIQRKVILYIGYFILILHLISGVSYIFDSFGW